MTPEPERARPQEPLRWQMADRHQVAERHLPERLPERRWFPPAAARFGENLGEVS